MLVQHEKRFKAITLLFLFLFFLLFIRLIYISITYKDLTVSDPEVTGAIERGKIVDTKNRLIADNIPLYVIFADPLLIKDKGAFSKKISPLLGLNADEVEAKLREKGSSHYYMLKQGVAEKDLEKLLALRLKGLFYRTYYQRQYLLGSMAANLLGFVDASNHGLEGLEYEFNGLLEQGAETGLQLALDSYAQYIVWEELTASFDDEKPEWAVAIVADAQNGDILSLVNCPNFNPEEYEKSYPFQRMNRAVLSQLEPGSTFKVFVTAALLNENLLSTSDSFHCDGYYAVTPNIGIRDLAVHGTVTIADILAQSCNVGMIKASERIDKQTLYNYFRMFNFGAKTGADYPSEGLGLLKKPSNWTKMTKAIINIGQEIATTPLQLISAFNSLVNGGYYYQPRFVKTEIQSRTPASESKPVLLRQVISEKTSVLIRSLLKNALTGTGTGRAAFTSITEVGGKTGTAQIPIGNGYSPDQVLTSFLGYFMYNGKYYTVYIALDNPKKTYFGGTNAAPLFKRIVERLYAYFTIRDGKEFQVSVTDPAQATPDLYAYAAKRIVSPDVVPDFTGLTLKESVWIAAKLGLKLKIEGSGFVKSQSVKPGTDIKSAGTIKLILAFQKPTQK